MENMVDFDKALLVVCGTGFLGLTAVFYFVTRSTYQHFPNLRQSGIRPSLVTLFMAALWLTMIAIALMGFTSKEALACLAALVILGIYLIYVWRRHKTVL